MSPEDEATIRQIVREEIETSKPKITLNPRQFDLKWAVTYADKYARTDRGR